MGYTIPVAVNGSGDPAAEFNAMRTAVLDLETRDVPPFAGSGWGLPGYVWWAAGDAPAGSAANTTVGNFWCTLVCIQGTTTLKGLRIHITTASPTAGATMRLGCYRVDPNTRLGTLMVDAGTVAVDSTGVKSIVGLTTVLTPAWYVIGGAPTAFDFSYRQHNFRATYAQGYDMNPDPRPPRSWHFSSVGTGALPSTSPGALSQHQDWDTTFVGVLMNW
jgi:hypothetical protein